MTDLHKDTLDRLKRTELALQARLDNILDPPDVADGGEYLPPDKWARSISGLMKALDDTATQRAAIETKIAAQTYTRYEDMPPPTPEDEARFHARFTQLIGEIIDARGSGDTL